MGLHVLKIFEDGRGEPYVDVLHDPSWMLYPHQTETQAQTQTQIRWQNPAQRRKKRVWFLLHEGVFARSVETVEPLFVRFVRVFAMNPAY
jgi:hypothetical protein